MGGDARRKARTTQEQVRKIKSIFQRAAMALPWSVTYTNFSQKNFTK